MSAYTVAYVAPGMWSCSLDDRIATTTIHDTKAEAEAYALRMDERLAWARIERGHLITDQGLEVRP